MHNHCPPCTIHLMGYLVRLNLEYQVMAVDSLRQRFCNKWRKRDLVEAAHPSRALLWIWYIGSSTLKLWPSSTNGTLLPSYCGCGQVGGRSASRIWTVTKDSFAKLRKAPKACFDPTALKECHLAQFQAQKKKTKTKTKTKTNRRLGQICQCH